jgi:Trypsin-like peptidase domain
MRPLIVMLVLTVLTPLDMRADRAIPDNNLAYPVLIALKSGAYGSGFFLNTLSRTYLVTARHVLFSEPDLALRSPEAELLSYSSDPKESTPNRLHLDLAALKEAGRIKVHAARDVAVVEIGIPPADPPGAESRLINLVPGVTSLQMAPLGIIGVARANIKKFDEILVANDVIVFGYPKSLGLKSLPQLDASRPLLRKGIVAGINSGLRSIILDCPAYPGNSGGPVMEAEADGFGRRFRIIGVVSQFVPNAEVWVNTTHGHTNTSISNSGYSVATPMDFVLELLEQ